MNEANFNLGGRKIETAKDRQERLKSLDMKSLGAEIFTGDGTAMDMVKAESLVEDLMDNDIDASSFGENVRIVLGKIASDMLEGGAESEEKQQLREFLVSINMEADAAVIENQWGEVQDRIRAERIEDVADENLEVLGDAAIETESPSGEHSGEAYVDDLSNEIQDGEVLEMGPAEDDKVQELADEDVELLNDNDSQEIQAAGEGPNTESPEEKSQDSFADFAAAYMLGGKEISSLRFEDLPKGKDGRVQISGEALASLLSHMERSDDTINDMNPEVRSLILHAVEDDNTLLVDAGSQMEKIRESITKLSNGSAPKSAEKVASKGSAESRQASSDAEEWEDSGEEAPEVFEPSVDAPKDAPDATVEWEDDLNESMKSAIDGFVASLTDESRIQKTDLSKLVRNASREIDDAAGSYLANKMTEIGVRKDQLTAGALAVLKKFNWEEGDTTRLTESESTSDFEVEMPAAERDAGQDLELKPEEKKFFTEGESTDYASDKVLDEIDNEAIDKAEAEQMTRDAEAYLASREGVVDIELDDRSIEKVLSSDDFAETKALIERTIDSNYAGYYDTAKDFASDNTMALEYPFTPEGYAQILVDIDAKAAKADEIADAVESQGFFARIGGMLGGNNARNMANAERLSTERAQLKELKSKYDEVLKQQRLLDMPSKKVKGLKGRVGRRPGTQKPLKGVA
jgi:hypothetical protein